MNRKLFTILFVGIILVVAVIGSGCADSGDAGTDEQTEDAADSEEVETVTEEVVVDDSTYTNSIEMEFVKIPAGEFTMGASEDETYSDRDERPQHDVTIGYDFYIGVYEVTQTEWEAVMGDNPSKFSGDDLPVEKVSWTDANKFIEALNEMEGTDAYRLPTEAEWEYAARAGTDTAYFYGDDPDMFASYGWCDTNAEETTRPVGSKEANAWGLYDVHGNVAEWVMDQYHSTYQGAPADGSEWTGGVDRRVFRGGSWDNAEENCRSATRDSLGEGSRADYIGLRLVKEI